jgi:broad specificity phosphatase PhoE
MGVIILVRHGQASFGTSDYDQLSELGQKQSSILGAELKARGYRADRIVCGTMRRHHQTADGCLQAMGIASAWDTERGWDEYDHDDVIRAFEPRYSDPASLVTELAASANPHKAFQEMFVRAMARWAGGAHDADYKETWTAFGARVAEALARLNGALGKGQGALVFTSGGPIAAVCSQLLHLRDDDALRLNTRLANAAITKLVCSSSAIHLSTLNEHGHFEGERAALMTYR